MYGFKASVYTLEQCEKTQLGTAELHSISDGELDLVIANSDTLGHFFMEFRLSKSGWKGQNESFKKIVTGGFDLNASFLQQMASDAASVLTMKET